MKKSLVLSLLAAVSFMTFSQTRILLTIGDRTMPATLVDNAATRELLALLQQGPITIQMSDYGGFEKVGALPRPLPASDTQITTAPGDIMLYQGNNMVIFYGTNSWSYTRLGKIDMAGTDNLRQFLGTGDVSLTISSDEPSAVDSVAMGNDAENTVYDLNGNQINSRPLSPGLYIINGEKTMVR